MEKLKALFNLARKHPFSSALVFIAVFLCINIIGNNIRNKIDRDNFMKEREERIAEELRRKFYIIGVDTIAELQYVEGPMVCVYTRQVLTEKDLNKMKGFADQFFPGDKNKMYFLFNEKNGNNKDNEEYYAVYRTGEYAKAPTKEERIQKLIETMNVYVSYQKGISYSTLFLEQLYKFIEDYNKLGKDERVKQALIKFQIKHFPIARREYVHGIKEKLWEKDIEVRQYGSTTIEYIGHMFASNKVKQNTFNEIENELSKLRFKKAIFRWYDGSEGTSWTMDVKSDNEL